MGVCLPRGAGLVAAVAGAWLAGAAYLPLDPGYPAGRLAFMAADAGAGLVVSCAELAGVAAGLGTEVAWLDDALAAAPAPPPPAAGVVAGSAAVVMYTSGSTGVPKGVVVTHGSLAAAAGAWAGLYGGAALRWLCLASVSFDVFTADVVRALCAGGTLIVAEPGLQVSAPAWAAALGRQGVQAVECAPRYASALAGYLAGSGRVLAGLALVVVTTDVWRTGPAAAAMGAWGPGVRVLTAYGVTEATVDSAAADLARLPGLAGGPDRPVPVGGPLPGTVLQVLDERLRPVPAGVPGELFIGGAGLARGYLGAPALTAARFIADPHSAAGQRLYATGDRARWRPGGVIEFLGRGDGQLKLRGYRIEPGEVEAALAAHPAIAAAVVAAAGHGDAARLAAWLVPAAPAGIPPAAGLRAWLAARLPAFMIPGVFTQITALPLHPQRETRPRCPARPRHRPPRPRPAHTPRRARPPRRSWPPSGPGSWTWTAPGSTTASSTSAATPCSPRRSSPASARRSAPRYPSPPSSTTPPSPAWPTSRRRRCCLLKATPENMKSSRYRRSL